MHVVMYKILAYLYDCMKKGLEPQAARIRYDSDMIGPIPERYWCSIMGQLVDKGLVKGVVIRWFDNEPHVLMADPTVTLENSMMKKALNFLREAKSTLPFI